MKEKEVIVQRHFRSNTFDLLDFEVPTKTETESPYLENKIDYIPLRDDVSDYLRVCPVCNKVWEKPRYMMSFEILGSDFPKYGLDYELCPYHM